MNVFGSGFIKQIIDGTLEGAEQDEFALLTEDNKQILTEDGRTILVEFN